MKLVALKELRYAGTNYLPGASFEASDRDARLLKAVKKAGDPPPAPEKPVHVDMPAPPAKEPNPGPFVASYLRRDMQAEDGRTGETTSLQFSRRGRPRKVQISED